MDLVIASHLKNYKLWKIFQSISNKTPFYSKSVRNESIYTNFYSTNYLRVPLNSTKTTLEILGVPVYYLFTHHNYIFSYFYLNGKTRGSAFLRDLNTLKFFNFEDIPSPPKLPWYKWPFYRFKKISNEKMEVIICKVGESNFELISYAGKRRHGKYIKYYDNNIEEVNYFNGHLLY